MIFKNFHTSQLTTNTGFNSNLIVLTYQNQFNYRLRIKQTRFNSTNNKNEDSNPTIDKDSNPNIYIISIDEIFYLKVSNTRASNHLILNYQKQNY